MEPTPNNTSSKIVSALVIGIIIGFIAGTFWQERRLSAPVSDNMATTEEEETAMVEEVSLSGDTETTASDQTAAVVSAISVESSSVVLAEIAASDQIAGDSAIVSILNISEPVWIAVRDNVDGKLGNILGAHKAFTAGDAEVNLLRPTVAGASYRVVMYKDIGDASFNYKEDVLLEKGQVVFSAI